MRNRGKTGRIAGKKSQEVQQTGETDTRKEGDENKNEGNEYIKKESKDEF